MVYSESLVTGYYVGPRHPQGPVLIPVHNHDIDNGYSVPILDAWFENPFHIGTMKVLTSSGLTFRAFYHQLDGSALPRDSNVSEVVIVRVDPNTHQILDMKRTERLKTHEILRAVFGQTEALHIAETNTERIEDITMKKEVKAYYFGTVYNRRAEVITVEVFRYHIGEGLDLPDLRSHFQPGGRVLSLSVPIGRAGDTSFILYAKGDVRPVSPGEAHSYEILVCRKETGVGFVNIQQEDEYIVGRVVCRYFRDM